MAPEQSTVTAARWFFGGWIEATIDGEQRRVPNDMRDPDRQAIDAWVAAGNTIGPWQDPAARE